MDELTIDIAKLRTAVDPALDVIESRLGGAVTLDVDFYWNVPLATAFDPLSPELDVGQVSDDISSVHEFASQSEAESTFVWHELGHLAGVLRALAKTDLP